MIGIRFIDTHFLAVLRKSFLGPEGWMVPFAYGSSVLFQ